MWKRSTKWNKKQAEIKTIKKNFAKDASGMKTEISQLKTIKQDLSNLIAQLKMENTQLKQSNEELGTQITASEQQNKELFFEIAEIKQLNNQLEQEKQNLMASSTRAANFRVDIRKKKDKPTGSARRARTIEVSFDIKNLPASKKGEYPVYLVVKDAKGIPVKVANPVKTTIKPATGSQAEEIIAQTMVRATLFESDRFQFKIEPLEGSLHKGFYSVAVYTEWGLLGGAQFQLR